MSELLPWHAMTPQDAVATLRSARGELVVEEVGKRLHEYGPNAVREEAPVSAAQLFFRQFASPFTLILLVAVIAGAYMHEWIEAGVVVFIILLNGFLGFMQEERADRALLALKNYLPQRARLRRAGGVVDVAARDIVPGDIMLLRAGDRIMADARILSTESFAVDESVLTGESQPVVKTNSPVAAATEVYDRKSMVFAGTAVSAGTAEVVVVATGERTQFASIAELATSSNNAETPFQHQLRVFANGIAKAAVVLCIAIFFIGVAMGFPVVSMVSLAASLAVAIVPEGLLVAMTVILAVGMQRMLKRKVLVRTLSAVETLGGVHVLCVDKTGTLTTGQMSVTEMHVGVSTIVLDRADRDARELVEAMHLLTAGDHGQTFTVRAVRQFVDGFVSSSALPVPNILVDVPFMPSLRYSARVVACGAKRAAYVFGAPDAILSRVDMSDDEIRQAHRLVEDMAKRGLRTIMFADATVAADDIASNRGPHDLRVLGVLGLSDPLRPSVPSSVAAARSAGIRTIMITGDHPETARAIAVEAGIVTSGMDRVLTGVEIANMSDSELSQRIGETAVFARVLPEQKLRIVQMLQSHHQVVAMTGDGINDAPALRAADVGIAVGHATDIARETADIVLLESDFATIIAAVEEGRAVFENIRKQVGFLMSFSLAEAAIVLISVLLGVPAPLLPLHILWLNLVADSLPGLALAFEPVEDGVMSLTPRSRSASLVSGGLGRLMALSVALTVLAVSAFVFVIETWGDASLVRTWTFTALGLSGVAAVFVFRVFRSSIYTSKPWRNLPLLAMSAVSMLLIVLPVATPIRHLIGFADLHMRDWLVITLFVVALLIVIDAVKVLVFRRKVGASVLSSTSIWTSLASKTSKTQ